MDLAEIAEENMQTRFKDNPCRGIVLGMNQEGAKIQIAWIMGRSDHSQNRVYVHDTAIVRTEAHDPSKLDDPSLIIYTVIRSARDAHIVSNGDQTDTLADAMDVRSTRPEVFRSALDMRFCEPDGPTFTSRIAGYLKPGDDSAYLAILKADPIAKQHWIHAATQPPADFPSGEDFRTEVSKTAGLDHHQFPTIRQYSELPLSPGIGYCLTTYKPGSKNLPSFEGEPFLVPMEGTLDTIMKTFWDVLEPQWRVALCGKVIEGETYQIAEPINMHLEGK